MPVPDPYADPPADPAPTADRSLTLVTEVPAASAQSTVTGQELHRLVVVGDQLLVAYGDFGANTGPIDVVSLDLTDLPSLTTEATLNTEETWVLREAGGSVYVPYIDPMGGAGNPENGQLAVRDAAGSWSALTNVVPVPVHVFDVAVTADGIFLFGSSSEPDPPNGGATVWHSADGGATWSVSLAPRPDPGNTARFYAAWTYGEDIYTRVELVTYHWPPGGPWVEISDDGPPVIEAVPFTYQGTPFHLCLVRGKAEAVATDGGAWVRTHPDDTALVSTIQTGMPSGRFRDACTDGTHLYLLDSNGTVHRSDADGVWTVLFTLDVIPASIAVADGFAYFGVASSIYRTAL